MQNMTKEPQVYLKQSVREIRRYLYAPKYTFMQLARRKRLLESTSIAEDAVKRKD